jgi:hypothetical protein
MVLTKLYLRYIKGIRDSVLIVPFNDKKHISRFSNLDNGNYIDTQ